MKLVRNISLALIGFIAFSVLVPISIQSKDFLIVDTAHAQTIPAAVSSKCSGIGVVVTANSNGTFTCTVGAEGGNTESYFDAQGNPTTQNGVAIQTVGTVANVQVDQSGNVISSCSAFAPSSWFTDCIWIPLLSWLGSWFVTLGGAVLVFAGVIFDYLIYHVIVDFGNTLSTLGISDAINTGWTLFRDLSNIAIIGMFTFIAIAIILGSHTYGQKKLVANVLIIAILINFSLLFTKIIIDISNFTAFQFYKTMSQTQNGQFDIASAFLKPMGINSVLNDSKIFTDNVANSAKASGSSGVSVGLQAFLAGLIGGIMLIGVGLVLLYGAFLIASRAILLILLMLTGSLAFATYLIPSLSEGDYGWSAWWKSLINTAIFAPLIMVFLSISLLMINAASNKVGLVNFGSTITSTLQNPAAQLANSGASSGWTIILLYVLGIGLLYGSFKLSASFAGTISGFKYASVLPAFGFAAGARFTGAVGRQTVGRVGLGVSNWMQAQSAKPGTSRLAAKLYDFGAQKTKTVAKNDFNLARTGLGSAVASTAGVKQSTLAGKEIKGFEGSQKAYIKKAAEQARRIASAADKDAIYAERVRNNPGTKAQHEDATEIKNIAETALKNQEKSMASLQEKIGGELKEARDLVAAEKANHEANPTDTIAKQRYEASQENLERTRVQHQNQMGEQTTKIKEARDVAQSATKNLENLKNFHTKDVQNAEQIVDKLVKNNFSATLMHATGITQASNDALVKKVKKETGKQEKQHHFDEDVGSSLKKLLKDEHKDEKKEAEDEHKDAPGPTPEH